MYLSSACRPLVQATAYGALALTLVSCQSAPKLPKTPESIEELAQALGPNYRPLQARLSGGFGYAPCNPAPKATTKPPPQSTSATPWDTDDEDLVPDVRCSSRLALTIPQQDQLALARSRHLPKQQDSTNIYRGPDDPAPLPTENLHLAAIAELAYGEGADLDRAVELLEAAAEQDPNNPKLLSDLAAAYLLRGQDRDHPRDLARALTAADKAVEIDPNLPEAVFNRAFALEGWSLHLPAEEAWSHYLELDPTSEYAKEAQARLDLLKSPLPTPGRWSTHERDLRHAALAGDSRMVGQILDRFRQPAREYAEEELLGRWAELWQENDLERAKEEIRIARAIGEALQALSGETIVHDAVETIDRALTDKDSKRLRALAKGHQNLLAASRQLSRSEVEAAKGPLVTALESLSEAESPLYWRALLLSGIGDYWAGRSSIALEKFRGVRTAAGTAGFANLVGRTEWLIGLTLLVSGQVAQSLHHYSAALARFEETGETQNAAMIHRLLAENYQLLGQNDKSWHYRWLALGALQTMENAGSQLATLAEAGRGAVAQHPGLAIYLHGEMLRIARDSDSPEAVVNASMHRASAYRGLGKPSEARDDLAEARRNLPSVGRQDRRVRMEADLRLVEASLDLEEDPARAIESLDRTIEFYHSTDHHFYRISAHFIRARAHLRAGNSDLAKQDLEEAIAESRRQVKTVPSSEVRISYLEQMRDVFDEMILFEIQHSSLDEAGFNRAEGSRAQVLLSLLQGLHREDDGSPVAQSLEPLTATEVRVRLPEGVTLLEYVVLQDRILTWLVTRDRILRFDQAVEEKELEEAAAALYQDLERRQGEGDLGRLLTILYDLLVRKMIDHVEADSTLVLVPDRMLSLVPFAALKDRKTGSYLIERNAIVVAPSATVYLHALERERQLARERRGSVLIVADPATSLDEFPYLPRLPGAAAQAAELSSLYQGRLPVRVLMGSAATRDRVLQEIGNNTVVHFGGHALSAPANPLFSGLALAPAGETGDQGFLFARDIYGHRFLRTRLLVLAACETAVGPISVAEGPLNLVRPFLSGGVPVVLATLWRIDDEDTRALLATFHRTFAEVANSTQALRTAQREALSLQRPIRSWAAFQLIGGAASPYQ